MGDAELFREAYRNESTHTCGQCGSTMPTANFSGLCGDCMEDEHVCGECGGEGYLSDGGCGGGCEYCRPWPTCGTCGGTGRTPATTDTKGAK